MEKAFIVSVVGDFDRGLMDQDLGSWGCISWADNRRRPVVWIFGGIHAHDHIFKRLAYRGPVGQKKAQITFNDCLVINAGWGVVVLHCWLRIRSFEVIAGLSSEKILGEVGNNYMYMRIGVCGGCAVFERFTAGEFIGDQVTSDIHTLGWTR